MTTDKCPHCGAEHFRDRPHLSTCGSTGRYISPLCRERAARQKAEEEAKGLREELAAIYGHPNPDDVTSLGAELGAEQARNLQLSDELAKAREEVEEARGDLGYERDHLREALKEARELRSALAKAMAEMEKSRAKLSERKTVHEWLNWKGVPSNEATGKPMCLLRRLAVALDVSPHAPPAIKDSLITEPHRAVSIENQIETMDGVKKEGGRRE